jgi:uncharacterized protein (DUF2384 family)
MCDADRRRVATEMDAWLAQQQRLTLLLENADPEVIAAAVDCFGSHIGAGRFLTSPARGLGYKIPVEIANTPEGKAKVLTLIRQIDYGVYL